MLKYEYGEEYKVQRSSEIETAKIASENSVDCIFFYAKCIICHEFGPEKQIVNGKLY
jgi:hypothetical protein